MKTSLHNRYPELDALRGVAVLLMVTYHFFFNLSYFYGFDIPVLEGWWMVFARGTASLFLLLVGVCCVISWKCTPPMLRWPRTLRRAGIILTGAILISLITWFVAPRAFIKFGILHLIGVSALIQPFFHRYQQWNLLIGFVAFFTGMRFATLSWSTHLLFPFGITYPGFASLDYYPLLPWFGVILLGMALGKVLYLPSRHPALSMLHSLPYPQWILWSGKRSLLLYFLQQPILFIVLGIPLGLPSV